MMITRERMNEYPSYNWEKWGLCAMCGSRQGEQCRTVRGRRRLRTKPHPVRPKVKLIKPDVMKVEVVGDRPCLDTKRRGGVAVFCIRKLNHLGKHRSRDREEW